ncbi:glycoside hydrolase family 108 protein [bacterium]|nr:glycoside hydrolase family 108 protein [bacterium]
MTNKVFDTAFKLLLKNEGGYVNDPRDAGGETKYGISKRAYPKLNIRDLTIEEAKEIYKRDYWDRCKCDFLPDALSVAVFDYAVNSGVIKAVKGLQKCLGIKQDGKIGNQTLCAVNGWPRKKLVDEYMQQRINFLMSLKGWQIYGNGWGKRVERVKKECEGLI